MGKHDAISCARVRRTGHCSVICIKHVLEAEALTTTSGERIGMWSCDLWNQLAVQYIYQKSSLQDFHLQDPSWRALGSVLELRNVLGAFLGGLWRSFSHSERGAGQQKFSFLPPREVLQRFLAFGPEEAFGWYLKTFLFVHRCFFTIIFVVRSWNFRILSEGPCGRCALHIPHALELISSNTCVRTQEWWGALPQFVSAKQRSLGDIRFGLVRT